MRSRITLLAFLAAAVLGSGTAHAANFPINWLDHSPVPFGSPVPSGSVFFMPGVGNVTVTHNVAPVFTHTRFQNACLFPGTLTLGANTYSWLVHEMFAATLNSGPDPLVPVQWIITYTFTSTQPAGSMYVGISGLGQTTSFGGGASVATVNQNGLFLGDWTGGCGPWGPTQYTGGVGTFQMKNSMNGAGGQDPHWNTPLGVVRIMDPVSSISIIMDQIRGDGVGVNIGHADSPTPSSGATWGRLKTLYR